MKSTFVGSKLSLTRYIFYVITYNSFLPNIPSVLFIMAPARSDTLHRPSRKTNFICFILLSMVILQHISSVNTTYFNYRFFDSPENMTFQGTYILKDGAVLFNSNENGSPVLNAVGRMLYPEPVRLWDRRTGTVADFTTTFSFMIKTLSPPNGGDGIVFFIAPNGSTIPPNSSGGSLGIVYENNNNGTQKPLIAVELDTYPNVNDPLSDHLGIDVNSIISVATWNTTLKFTNNTRGNAWIGYNSSTKILGVSVSFDQNPVFDGKYLLTHAVNIKNVLPELVNVGLSASTGNAYEVHNIYSWEFNSTEFPLNSSTRGTQVPRGSGTRGTQAPQGSGSGTRGTQVPRGSGTRGTQAPQGSGSGGSQVPQGSGTGKGGGKKKNSIGLLIGLAVGGTVLAVGLGLIFFLLRKKRKEKQEEEDMFDATGDPYYVRGAGPRRFTYKELDRATSHFAKDGKLGKGGFGEVYKGFVNDSNMNVAVKKVSRGSKQGKKEFVSEVRIISRLRHKNLVKLIGWCHERGEFLLVYELMPNGSLDSHLFGRRAGLTWELRYKIALGLATALLYLHDEWEQCVVHRDIKSSNVMLDSAFNVKLGDFGLARLVDHETVVKTTTLAGTMGYLAPECFTTYKAGKESDVYSFGVVALEIACGRKAVEPTEEEGKIGLVAWMTELYENGKHLEAVDTRLNTDFDEQQLERLMVVGLWCSTQDHNLRPSMRQAISVLNFDSPLPDLSSRMLVPNDLISPNHTYESSNATYDSSILLPRS